MTTCDTIFKQAIAAGGTEMKALQDQFYGDRSGTLTDPFGHVWTVATHKEDVSPEEIEKRLAAMQQARRAKEELAAGHIKHKRRNTGRLPDFTFRHLCLSVVRSFAEAAFEEATLAVVM